MKLKTIDECIKKIKSAPLNEREVAHGMVDDALYKLLKDNGYVNITMAIDTRHDKLRARQSYRWDGSVEGDDDA